MSQNTQTTTQTTTTTFLILEGFTKKVGRTEPSYDLTAENVEKVWPTEDGKKSTIGFTLIDENHENAAAFEGVHMTGACLTAKNDLSAVQALADRTFYYGATVKPIGYTFFGPNLVIILRITKTEDKSKFRALNAVGTPEGQTDERVWHVSIPLKKNADGNWVKRFDDVSDEKFAYWLNVLNSIPSLEGKTDEELLVIINSA
jgi:hypothetical protein